MREYEKPVFDEFKEFANVVEAWGIYDSIVICNQLYGSESTVPGWYQTFAAFGARERHSLFKNRTATTAGRPYNNMKNADTMDFAFVAHSIGLEITGPPCYECQAVSQDGNGVDAGTVDAIVSQWFTSDFPRHCGIEFRVNQDTRVELPAVACPAGVGAVGGGASFDTTNAVAPAFADQPFMTAQATQGVSLLSNRYPLPDPIGIPRTATIEGVLHISEWARNILQNITGPHQFMMNSTDGAVPLKFGYARYIVRMSIFGERRVQQRGQYHR